MKWPFILLVRIYQKTLSRILPASCRFTPTCSEYMIQAVMRRGLVEGFLLGSWRVLRCNPFAKGGYDPVENAPELNMKKYIKNFWFLATLVAIFIIVFSIDFKKDDVAGFKGWVTYIIVLNVFLMSFSLRPEMLLKGALNVKGQAAAFIICYALIPVLMYVAAKIFFSGDVGMFAGLVIAGAVPTTLVSASVWARLSGGNDGFSMVFTIISNSAGVVITPLIVAFFIAGEIDAGDMHTRTIITKLFLILILPVMAGQALRLFAGRVPEKARPAISNICQVMVLCVIFIAVANGKCDIIRSSGPGTLTLFIILAAVVLCVHVFAFFASYFGGRLLKVDRPDSIALAFSGSQKTLQVGIIIAMCLTALPAFQGPEFCYIMFPIIFFHAIQLAVDVVFIELFKRNRL